MSDFSIICLSQGSWDAPLPTNRQQIIRRAAALGHRTLYVETSPFLGRSIATGLARRSLDGLLAPVAADGGVLRLAAPNPVPRGRSIVAANRLNALTAALAVRRAARALPAPVVLWVYDPLFASLIGACGETASIYDCVDDYGAIGFYSARERRLAAAGDATAGARADVVAATTRTLYERHRLVNPHTHLVPNVGDHAHFSQTTGPAPPEVRGLHGPVIGFAGNLMPEKVDLELLAGVAAARPDWTLVLVGPAAGEAGRAVEELARRPNVVWLGPRPYRELPAYVARFDVGLCPNRWNDYGRSCFPLKVYEYLAAGKPVVASGNPDLAEMEPDVRLARGVDAFVDAVAAALDDRSADAAKRRSALAAGNTWETRTSALLELAGHAVDRNRQLRRARRRRDVVSAFDSIRQSV